MEDQDFATIIPLDEVEDFDQRAKDDPIIEGDIRDFESRANLKNTLLGSTPIEHWKSLSPIHQLRFTLLVESADKLDHLWNTGRKGTNHA